MKLWAVGADASAAITKEEVNITQAAALRVATQPTLALRQVVDQATQLFVNSAIEN